MFRVSAQGHVLEVKRVSKSTPLKADMMPPPRSIITQFSKKSRKRLLELFNRLDVKGRRAVFVTLTFTGCPETQEAYKAFRRLMERWRRRYRTATGVWRKEEQKRGSIHYHLIMIDLPFIPQAELQDMWTACTREERSIVDIRLIRSHRELMSYVSKYVAKTDKRESSPSLVTVPYPHVSQPKSKGRMWGYFRKAMLPFAQLVTMTTRSEGAVRYLHHAMKWMSRWRCAKGFDSAMLFTDQAYQMFEHFFRQHESISDRPAWLKHAWTLVTRLGIDADIVTDMVMHEGVLRGGRVGGSPRPRTGAN